MKLQARTSTNSRLQFALFLLMAAVAAPFTASAQSGGGGFDASAVLTVIAAMLASGVLIWTAWTAAKWTLKAFGIIGGRS